MDIIIVSAMITMPIVQDFSETPVPQEVVADSNAVFRCRHPTADFIIWMVNDTFIGANPPPDITPNTSRDEDGNLVHTLTIVARAQYNGTTIVFVAVFLSGAPPETTAPVMLLVQDNGEYLQYVCIRHELPIKLIPIKIS